MADDFIPGVTECIHLIHASETGKIRTGRANVAGIDPGPKGAGVFDIACSPGSTLPSMATSETSAVTCPACKATEVFKTVEADQKSIGNGSAADKAANAAIAVANEQKAKRLAEIAAESNSGSSGITAESPFGELAEKDE